MKRSLFSPIQIGTLRLKNRIVMAPMGTTTDTSNTFNMRDVNYYGERARGGVGLVMTGAVVASEEFEPAPCQKLTGRKDVYMLSQVAERVHMYGAKLGIQLSPGIGRMNWIDPTTPPYSASPCPNYYTPDLICRELPTDGVKRLVAAIVRHAARLSIHRMPALFPTAPGNKSGPDLPSCGRSGPLLFLRQADKEPRQDVSPAGVPLWYGVPERNRTSGLPLRSMACRLVHRPFHNLPCCFI